MQATSRLPKYPFLPESRQFAGKRVIVTGSSSGIGKKIAKMLLRRGAFVVLVSRRTDKLQKIADDPKNTGSAVVYGCDLTDPINTELTFRAIMETLQNKLDIIVNAAGTLLSKTLQDTTVRDWDYCMNINLRCVLQITSLASVFLKASKGCIVNVSSIHGMHPKPGSLAFSVSKACLNMLTKCSALEFAPYQVRVNAVAAGVTETKGRVLMPEESLSLQENQFLMNKVGKETPLLKKAATKEDIAEAVLWLASDAAQFVTGEIMVIDGGASLQTGGCYLGWSQSTVQNGALDFILNPSVTKQ